VCLCRTVAARLVAKSEVYCYGQRLSITSYTSVASPSTSKGCECQNTLDSTAASKLSVNHSSLQGSRTVVVECPNVCEISDDDYDDDDDADDEVLISDPCTTVKGVCTATCSTRSRSHDTELCAADCIELSDNDESLCSDSSAPLSLVFEGWLGDNIPDSAAAESESSVERPSQTVILAPPRSTEVSDSVNDAVLSSDEDAIAWRKNVTVTTAYPPCDDAELCVVKVLGSLEPSSGGNTLSPRRRSQSYPECNAEEEPIEDDDRHKRTDDDSKDDDNGDLVICERDVVKQSSEMSVLTQKSQSQSELELHRENVELNAPSSKQTRKLCFPEKKLCLLEKIVAAGNVKFPCTMRVVMEEKAVEFVAADDEVVEAEIKLYELVANFSSASPHLPAGVVKLLLSDRGQRWLQSRLASFGAVFHAEDSVSPCVIAIDCVTSADVKCLLETSLSCRTIHFDDEHSTFLQSAHWRDAVDRFQSEYFVSVTTDCRQKKISLEGCVEALNDVGRSVETLLRQNSRVQRKITTTPEQFQLLLHFRVEIYDRLKSEALQHQQNRCLLLR